MKRLPMNPEQTLPPLANDLDLPPLVAAPATGVPLFTSVLPMLRGVSVRVEVRLGAASLTLAELAEIESGAILALDRALDEPVEILIGEHVIARGTLVAVDDRFGVCITEAPLADADAAEAAP